MAEEINTAAEMDTAMDPPDRPCPDRRKSSFSDTLSKFATNTFNRRRTVANITTDISALSRLPDASGRGRSTSFFGNLNGFGSRAKASGPTLVSSSSLASFPRSGSHKIENQPLSSRPTRLSTRFAQTPFFSRQASAPVTTQHNHPQRESNVQIIQHHLMAPLGPPAPRRKTLGDMQRDLPSTTSSPRTPSYARTTSSSENRRRATLGALREDQIVTPTNLARKTPTTASSGKGRSGTPHPKHTPASTSSGKSRIPVRAAPKASETPTPTAVEVPEPKSHTKARVSFSEADESLIPTSVSPLQHQIGPEVDESETPTPTPGSPYGREIVRIRQLIEAAQRASVPENLGPAEVPTEGDISEEAGSRAATPIPQNPRLIFIAMPRGYWSGRLMALSDRFRTEEMQNTLSFNRVGSMHDDTRRIRRVFVHLNSLCQTDVAKESLAAFKTAYEALMEEEEDTEDGRIVKGKGKKEAVVADKEDDEEEEGGVVLVQEKKGGFFGKLAKKGKKGRKKSGGR